LEIESPKQEKLIQKSAIIIGIGNTLRKDDGVGIIVVEALERSLGSQGNITYETMQTGGVDILGSIEGFNLAIIADAAFMDAKPGEARWLEIEKASRSIRLYSSTHSVGILETLQIAKNIQNLDLPGEIAVLGIQAKEIEGFGEKLTKEVAEGAEVAFNMILDKLKAFGIIDRDLILDSPEF
jgi:hydrogenase maturation protease